MCVCVFFLRQTIDHYSLHDLSLTNYERKLHFCNCPDFRKTKKWKSRVEADPRTRRDAMRREAMQRDRLSSRESYQSYPFFLLTSLFLRIGSSNRTSYLKNRKICCLEVNRLKTISRNRTNLRTRDSSATSFFHRECVNYGRYAKEFFR